MPDVIVFDGDKGGFNPKDPEANVIARERIPDAPLDPAGVLATLLTVKGVITEDEAQAASGRTITELRNEAKAWEAAKPPRR